MNTRAAIVFVVLVLAVPVGWAADNKATNDENKILSLVLKRLFTDGGYTVVNPETRLPPLDSDDPKEIRHSERYVTEHLQTHGIAVKNLVDRLFDHNKKPVRLTIKSSPKDGYVIDFDGKYAKYFDKDGGGWERWYEENPKAHGSTNVSLPVYDKITGLVLVYIGTQSDWLAGSGWIILYRYEKGELQEIQKVIMWIS